MLMKKMFAYDFDLNSLTFFYSYIKNRKQSAKINNICSVFQILLSAVPQGSILEPILLNIFINDLLMRTKVFKLQNFADDNTITSSSGTLSQPIKDLQSEANKAIDWFKVNNMIVNHKKVQTIMIDKKSQNNNPTEINIDGKRINSIIRVRNC